MDDANLYRYVGNYTTGATDPTGLYPKSFSGGGSLGVDFGALTGPSPYDVSNVFSPFGAPTSAAPSGSTGPGGGGTTFQTTNAAPKTAAPSKDAFELYAQMQFEESRAYSGPIHHDVRSGRSYSFGSRGELIPLETYGNEAGRQVLETVGLGVLETAVGVLWEPADWALTAFAIAQEPTNPWNYVGFIPFIPASVRHLGKVDNLVGGLARHGDEVVGPMKNLGGSIDDAAYKARTYDFSPAKNPTVPKSAPKPRTTKVQPVEGAGPHTGFKRDPQTGQITGHTTFDENGFIIQRTDVSGRAHGGVPTPHTHVHGPPNVAPDGRVFPGREIEVRPAFPHEIPGSGGR
jgi:hypothetical protein